MMSFYKYAGKIVNKNKNGLGGVLRQKHGDQLRPVAFASRTMTDAEKRFAQIEKECMASV